MDSINQAQQLVYQNNVLSAIRDINQSIVKEKNRDIFIQKTCEILISTKSYLNAWIVLFDEQGNYLNSAQAGLDKEFRLLVELFKKNERTKCIDAALETNAVVVVENPDNRCSNCPLSELCEDSRTYYMQLGFNNKVFGILSVSIPKSFVKDKKEQDLFNDVAESIGFVIQSIELEKGIKKSKSRYKALFEAINDAIFVHPLNKENFNTFIEVNHVACKRLGYTREELLKMSPKDISAPLDIKLRGNQKERGKLLRDRWMIFEAVHITKTGKKIPVEISSRIFDLEGEPVIMTMARDITVRKQIELELVNHRINLEKLVKDRTEELETTNEELLAANEELSEKNDIINKQNIELKKTLNDLKDTQVQLLQADKMASLGILTSGVAHEINNPLNYILGSYEGLADYFNDNNVKDSKIQILLNSLKTGVERAADIVKGLNQFSRSNDDYNEECDIHSIIRNCLIMLQNQLKNRIETIVDFKDEIVLFSGNVGKLHEVFINLLTNSIQSIDNTGIITINAYKKRKFAIIEIIDTGCGIYVKDLKKITDPFFTTKDQGKGTGLGLSITYTIVKEHNGKIEFESERGIGTKVTIFLPFKNE